MIKNIYITRLFTPFVVLLASMFLHSTLAAITLGIVADNATKDVTVFNADTDTVLGFVHIPGPAVVVGAVVMTADQKLAFVTDLDLHVWVIDLSNPSAPVLASGINPIPIPINGLSLAISPDNKFLAVSDGNAFPSIEPIVVIDIATRTVVDIENPGNNTDSVNFAQDGSLLTTAPANLVRRFTISPTGQLTSTGILPGQNDPHQAYGTMNAGVVINFGSSNIQSFTLPSLTPVDSRPLSSIRGLAGVFSPDNTLFYARASATVDVFGFNPITGSLSLTPSLTFPTGPLAIFFGIQQMAIYPNGTKLYVPVLTGAVNVHNALTGALITTITGPSISQPNGIAIRLAPPTLSKSFNPTFINLNGQTTLTINLGNTNGSDLALSTDFSDTLPSNLSIMGTPTTTCTGTAGFFTFTANSLTLLSSANATIPAGGCTISATVTASVPGTYVNTTSTLSVTGVPLIIGPARANLGVFRLCL